MDETIHTAARRVVRFFNICMQHGGLIDTEFEIAMLTLSKEVEKENERIKKEQSLNNRKDITNEDRRD